MTLIRGFAMAAAVLLGTAAFAIRDGKLDRIDIRKTASGLDILVMGQSLPEPKTQAMLNGTSFMVDFDADLTNGAKMERINHSGVRYAELVWYGRRPPRARLHLKLDRAMQPEIRSAEGGWLIRFTASGARGAVLPDPSQPMTPPVGPVSTVSDEDRRAMEQAVQDLERGVFTPAPAPRPTANAGGPLPLPTVEAIVTAPPAATVGAMAPAALVQDGQKVTVDFVNADIVQIVKALSLESGFNVIAAPDVSPSDKPMRLTVSLQNESLENALGLITGIAQLRYTRIGRTFIVTRRENFEEALAGIVQSSSERMRTNVVHVMSGQGQQIQRAVQAVFPNTGRGGYYQVILPSARDGAAPAVPTEAGAGPMTGIMAPPMGGERQGQAPKADAKTGQEPVFYLIVVGEEARVDEVSEYARQLDRQIIQGYEEARGEDMGTVVVPIVSSKTEQIKSLLQRHLAENPRRDIFQFSEGSLQELSEGDIATYYMMMVGPKSELDRLAAYAKALDESLCEVAGIPYTPEDRERFYEVLDLRFLEPIVAEQDLKNRIRGLYVTLVPDPVWPGLTGEDEGQKTEAPTDPNSPEKAGQAESQTSKLNRAVGREPMKLMVRGTRSAINEAKQYLSQIDVAYKQVALQMQVVEIRKSDALQLGLDWTLLTTGPLRFFNMSQGGGTPGTPGTIGLEDQRGIYTNQLQATIDELDGALKVLSVPNTFVRDGGQSEIFVGDTIRYIESIQSTQNGVQVQTKDLDVGISLQVRPRVGADGNIAMQLFVNSSLLNRFDSVPGGGQLPQTSERRQTTEFGMKSGEMIALGGLIQDIDRNTVSGIPILKDLPIIGKLFSRTTTSRDQTSLVFFITATEVTDSNRETAADPRLRPADPTGRTKVKIGG